MVHSIVEVHNIDGDVYILDKVTLPMEIKGRGISMPGQPAQQSGLIMRECYTGINVEGYEDGAKLMLGVEPVCFPPENIKAVKRINFFIQEKPIEA